MNDTTIALIVLLCAVCATAGLALGYWLRGLDNNRTYDRGYDEGYADGYHDCEMDARNGSGLTA